MLRITGAVTVTISPRLISCVVMCATSETKRSNSDLRRGPSGGKTCRVREKVEATPPKARSVRGDIESRVATLAVGDDASAARTAEEISSPVKEVVEYSNAQASRVTADVTQRLEKEIVAVATSTAAMAEVTTCTVVEGVQRDIQAQLE